MNTLPEIPCSTCDGMFWPLDAKSTQCPDCVKDAELTKLKADVVKLRTALKKMVRLHYDEGKASVRGLEAVQCAARALEETKP